MSYVRLKEEEGKDKDDELKHRVTQLETSLHKKGVEIKTLLGRIKGYETLNHLFQEVKQQYQREKKINEELQQELLSSHSGPPLSDTAHLRTDQEELEPKHIIERNEPTLERASHTLTLLSGEKTTPKTERDEIQGIGSSNKQTTTNNSGYDPCQFDPFAPAPRNPDKDNRLGTTNLAYESFTQYGMMDATKQRRPSQERELSLSFPSIQNKNWSGSDDSSPNSTKANHHPGSSHAPLSSQIASDIDDLGDTADAGGDSVKYYLQKLVDKFQEPPLSSSFIADIVNLVPRAVRMDKQVRLQQIMIDDLTNENNKLRQQLTMTHTRDTSSKNGAEEGKTEDKEWVHVQKEATANSASDNEPPSHVEVISHLQKKIRRLQSHIQTLGHGKKEAEEQVNLLLVKVNKAGQQENKVYGQQERDQGEMGRLLKSAVRQADEAEELKNRAMSDLKREKNRISDLQQQLGESRMAERRTEEQVELLHTTNTAHQKLVEKLKEEIRALKMRPSSPEYLASVEDSLPANPRDMKTEIRVLRQQIMIYKEDFDRERQDREAAQNEKSEIEQNLLEARSEISSLTRDVSRLREKVLDLEADRDRLDALSKRKSDELRQVQQQAHHWEERWQQVRQLSQEPMQPGRSTPNVSITAPVGESLPPAAAVVNQATSPPERVNTNREKRTPPVNTQATWPCIRCTYENLPQRIFCEMCGTKAPHLRGDYVEPQRHVPMVVEQLADPYRERPHRHGHQLVSRGMFGGRLECDAPTSDGDDSDNGLMADGPPKSINNLN